MAHNEVYLKDRFILHPDAGKLDVVHQARVVLHGATAQVSYHLPGGQQRRLCLAGAPCLYRVAQHEATLAAGNDDIALTWHIGLDERTFLTLDVRNRSRSPLHLDEITVLHTGENGLDLGARPTAWSFFQNGWQSWSPALARRPGSPAVEPDTADYRNKHLPVGPAGPDGAGDGFSVIRGRDLSLLAGFVTTGQNISSVRLRVQDGAVHSLQAACAGDGAQLAAGATWVSETLLLAVDSQPMHLPEDYMSALAEAMHAHVPDHIPTGWCTWYYYYGENSEQDILANMARIKEQALSLEYILIDDGYQSALGDWTSFSDKFPNGLPRLLDKIRAAGFKPGVWLAPFGMAQDSRLCAEHPDWALTDDDGRPVLAWQHAGGAGIYALDCTQPAVQDWLSGLFRTMAEEWGVELFKIDFCFAAALPGCRYDPSSTRALALRRGLEVIRAAIGDRFLLGCGLPLGPAVGLVDGMRIGTDVAFYWKPFTPDLSFPAMENALRNVITRSASHGRLWLNDPDCVMVRPRGDSTDLRAGEVRTMCALMALSGGLLLDSDNLETLPAGRVRLLQRLLPPSGVAATPLDLMYSEMPCLLVLPGEGPTAESLIVAVINWADETVSTEVDIPAFLGAEAQQGVHVYDLLSETYLGLARDVVTFDRHLPHATVLLLLKAATPQPALLASTFHLLGGRVEVKQVTRQDSKLTVLVEKAGRQSGKLAFTVPPPYRVVAVRVNGRRRPWHATAVPGAVEVRFTLHNRATVELEIA